MARSPEITKVQFVQTACSPCRLNSSEPCLGVWDQGLAGKSKETQSCVVRQRNEDTCTLSPTHGKHTLHHRLKTNEPFVYDIATLAQSAQSTSQTSIIGTQQRSASLPGSCSCTFSRTLSTLFTQMRFSQVHQASLQSLEWESTKKAAHCEKAGVVTEGILRRTRQRWEDSWTPRTPRPGNRTSDSTALCHGICTEL